jgi:hypothetical protein
MAFSADGASQLIQAQQATPKTTFVLLDGVLTNQTSREQELKAGKRIIQAWVTGTGALTATVTWYGKMLKSSPAEIVATSALSANNADQTYAELTVEWPIIYCISTDLTGTSAKLSATVSV